ncbi:MAG TPA: hypothetical protein VGG39_03265 [Polyangiaceae bacterium]
MRAARAALLGVVLAACGGAPAAPVEAHPAYVYALAPPGPGSWKLEVEARFDAAPSGKLVAPEAGDAIGDVALYKDEHLVPLAAQPDGWAVPSCRARCTLRYTVDLEELARGCHRMDCARMVGGAVLGPASAWMLRPEPMGDAEVRVAVRGGDASRFVTGLRKASGGGYVMRARELGEASFTAFGDFRRVRAPVPGATLDVALLGQPLAMGDAAAVGAVKDAAGCVAGLFGRFPVDATVFVVPVRGAEEVVFGRVLSLAGASVALLFGEDTKASAMHGEWVPVHELFHLATPSFVGEAHWLEEGLATYYEPILRERAGWTRPDDLWRHFADQMKRGLRKPGDPAALEDRDDIDSTYWGGALFAFLADVQIREATAGKKSLDDALRAALTTLGDATHTATLADFVRVGDEATGAHVLADLVAHDAVAGEPVDLDRLWASLGVVPRDGGAVELRDDAPEAALRKALSAGQPH